MYKVTCFLWILMGCSNLVWGQLFQDFSSNVNIRHYAVDSLRIGGGVVAFDYDNDGLEDLFLTGGERSVDLYKNLGNFDFERVTEASGLSDMPANVYGANAADLNNDGWQDLVMGTGEGAAPLLYRNNGDGSFTDISPESGFQAHQYWNISTTFADFNADGFLDIYFGNYARDPKVPLLGSSEKGAYPNELFLSQGEAFNYSEVAVEKGVAGSGFTLAVSALDLDQDHDIDLYIANDFGPGNNEPNRFFENDGQGNFTEKSAELGLALSIFGMGVGMADTDGDQDFDLYLSDLTQNHFLQQQTDGTFSDITTSTFATGNYVSWGATFFDADHDALPDLFMTNGQVLGEEDQPNLFYSNLGGTFLETQFNQVDPPFFSRGWALSDLDNDGDLDIAATVVIEKDTVSAPQLRVYRNTANLRHPDRGYLQVQLQAVNFNREALGSLIKLYLSDGTVLLQAVGNGGAFASKHSSLLHFGLNGFPPDSLEVFWPDGQRSVYQNLPTDALLLLHETEGMSILRGNAITGFFAKKENFIFYIEEQDNSYFLVCTQNLERAQVTLTNLLGQIVWKSPLLSSTQDRQLLKIPEISNQVVIATLTHAKGAYRKKILLSRSNTE